MAVRRWTLIDAENDVHCDGLSLGPHEIGCENGRVALRRRRGGLSEGVDVLELDNGALRVAVLPTRGMGLWKIWCAGKEIGWRSPVRGPVHPQFVPIADPSGLGWLDGFDELLCRCGLSSNGAPDFNEQGRLTWPLHGRIANLPAHWLELSCDDAVGEITVRGAVDECRFHFLKLRLETTLTLRLAESRVRIVDRVTNLSGAPGEMQLLYHINFGEPLLSPGASVVTPVKTLAPRDAHAAGGLETWNCFGPAMAGVSEQVYFSELLADAEGCGAVLLKAKAGDFGVVVRQNLAQLPLFVLWKNPVASQDGYVAGLEPAANFPNPRSFEKRQGRVKPLAPGESASFELELAVHTTADSVAAAEQSIANLQSATPATIYRAPRPEWST